MLGRRLGAAGAAAVVLLAGLVPGSGADATPTPSCDGLPGAALRGSGAANRTALTRAQFGAPAGLVPTSAFALPPDAAPPTHEFNATISLVDPSAAGAIHVLKDTSDYTERPGIGHLPFRFSLGFVQDCSYLIPVARGLQITGDRNWNVIISPGRVWNERGDGGWTRASFPFTLVERNANCTHNGLMSFLFTATAVTPIAYEVTKETCQYFQFDMWGQMGAATTPLNPGGAQARALRSSFAAEEAARLPTRPIASLARDDPARGLDLSALTGGVPPAATTTYGMYFGGIDYVAGCPTRDGPYPYCDEMILPSYSVAKSLIPGLGLLELAHEFGPGVSGELVRNLLPITDLAVGDWSHVTLQNLADMASGNYGSSSFEADENGEVMTLWLGTARYVPKLALALSFPHQAAPGTVWVYHTSDAFLLALAESRLLASRAAGNDIWDHLVKTVFAPLHIGPDSLAIERVNDASSGPALGGLGVFLTQDAVAKIARFLGNDGGRIGGRQVLDPGLLASALQRRGPAGLETDPPNTSGLYHDDLWASRFEIQGCAFRVPYMSGYGGITVAMMPNGAAYYAFHDDGQFAWAPAVKEAAKLAPQCPGG